MLLRILTLSCLLALMPGLAGLAHGEPSAQTAALLANWPDGASGNVAISEQGSDVPHAYHVTRRGSRLTIFDRSDRRYRTFHLSRSGSVVTVWDRAAATRTAYVMRGRDGVVGHVARPGEGYRRSDVRSTLTDESARGRSVGSTERPRIPSHSRGLRSRIRALDRTLSGVKQTLTPLDAAVLSIVTDP